jgi:hypothetical protein
LFTKQNNLPVASFGQGTAGFTGLSIHVGGNLWTPQKANFGPQLGFNFSPMMFKGNMTIRGGYGLNFNQEEIAISANAGNNPPTQNYDSYSFTNPQTPGANGAFIQYGISSSPTSLAGFAPNPHTITSYNTAGLPTAGSANIVIIGDGHGGLPTTYVEHFSLDTEYQLGKQLVASLGYEGSVSRHLINHQTPNSAAVVAGIPLNSLVPNGGGDYWTNEGMANNNALLAELKHPFSHHFSLDGQYMWAKSMDTDGSGPYYEDPYFPARSGESYGRSDFNIGQSFKVFGLWQPVFFKGNHSYLEKVAGGWSLSGIFSYHTGFPWTPNYGLSNSLYCAGCGYYNLRPYYLGGGGTDHSNKAFENATNFAGIVTGVTPPTSASTTYANKFFTVPNYGAATTYTTATGGPATALPPLPGLARNSFTGPGYRDVDASLTKAFGVPNNRLTGENARLEIRADAFNLFNLVNLNPASIANNIVSSNFGQDTQSLGSRTISFQARFSF